MAKVPKNTHTQKTNTTNFPLKKHETKIMNREQKKTKLGIFF